MAWKQLSVHISQSPRAVTASSRARPFTPFLHRFTPFYTISHPSTSPDPISALRPEYRPFQAL